MKKILVTFGTALSLSVFSQSSLILTNTTNSAAIAPNSDVYITTIANTNTQVIVDLKNTSSSTKAYNLIRNNVTLNSGASAYFCFGGNCYTDQTFISPNSLTLAAGQSASQVTGSYMMLTADLDEAPAVGLSDIEYTFMNAADSKDNVIFHIKYNYAKPLGIKEITESFSSFEIFPNPTNESTCLNFTSRRTFESTILLINMLGAVVLEKQVSVTEGGNKIDMDVKNLPAGVYFANIKNGNNSISKKLIIN